MDAHLLCIVNALKDVCHMLLKCLLQLELAMPLTALAEQVDVAASTIINPIERRLSIHKAQHLHPIEHVTLTSPTADALHGFLLTVRHTCRSHLNAVHIQLRQEHARNQQLFVRHKAHAIGLLTVAERSVHDFYELIHAFIQFGCKVKHFFTNHLEE